MEPAAFGKIPCLLLTSTLSFHELHVHFEELDYIDHACLDLLMNWEKQHQAQGGSLVIDWDSLTARFQAPVSRPGRPRRSEREAPALVEKKSA